jgi:hypothetical protein
VVMCSSCVKIQPAMCSEVSKTQEASHLGFQLPEVMLFESSNPVAKTLLINSTQLENQQHRRPRKSVLRRRINTKSVRKAQRGEG